MATLNMHFQKFVRNLAPPVGRQQLAQDLPGYVRDYLRKQERFATADPHTRLAGSYAQYLTVGNIKDVDVLTIIKFDPKVGLPDAKQTINSLRSVLDGLKDEKNGLDGLLVSNVEIKGNRRSVTVTFTDHDFQLDVVPVAAPDGIDSALRIPDRGFEKWVETHPLGVVALIGELDDQYGKKVRKLGKTFKAWRNYSMIYMAPKSYWLTSMLLYHVQNTLNMEQPLPLLFRDLVGAVHAEFKPTLDNSTTTPKVPDPKLEHDVAHSWARNDFESFMRHLEDARSAIDQALKQADNDDLEGAVEICQERLFGSEYFPTDVEDEIKARVALAMPGASFVTQTGKIVSAPSSQQIATPVPPTRFYGSNPTE